MPPSNINFRREGTLAVVSGILISGAAVLCRTMAPSKVLVVTTIHP